jgi:hypothetical protein
MIWAEDWAWGALSSVVLIFFHVTALFVMSMFIFNDTIVRLRSRSLFASILVFSLLGTSAVLLHALEAAGWAGLYWRLGAADDYAEALLHSLGAYSTMGDSTITFEKKWRLLLQIESLTAAVSLGLTTAFLFSALSRLQRVIDSGRAKLDNS